MSKITEEKEDIVDIHIAANKYAVLSRYISDLPRLIESYKFQAFLTLSYDKYKLFCEHLMASLCTPYRDIPVFCALSYIRQLNEGRKTINEIKLELDKNKSEDEMPKRMVVEMIVLYADKGDEFFEAYKEEFFYVNRN